MGDYELYHASTRKHKYIKKIGNRYFYTQQEISAYLEGKKGAVKFDPIKDYSKSPAYLGPDGKPRGGKTIGARMYYDKNKKYGGYNKSIGVLAENKKVTLQTTDKDYSLDFGKAKKAVNKKRKQAHELKEAVAEATGKRDVYFEAKRKVSPNGRAYYDDDNAALRTGKKDKKGRVDKEDGSVYTKNNTMQYDNEYTRERNKKTRARGRKKIERMTGINITKLRKYANRGRKAIRNLTHPKSTVTITDRVDGRTGKHF